MKNKSLAYPVLLIWLALIACNENIPSLPPQIDTAKKVEVRQYGDRFSLYRDGKPYYVKGAAGSQHLEALKAAGGNSIRTWNTEGIDSLLDQAQNLDLTVTVGLYVRPQRHGMDYQDLVSVTQQRERILSVVRRYKNHPAVLMWGIGNELGIDATGNQVWKELGYLSDKIHEIDPNHPTTTMIRPRSETTSLITDFAPSIDLISFNVFGALGDIPERIRRFWWNWDKPYLISEWGGQGWWECRMTDWVAPTEMLNRLKVPFYKDRYQKCMGTDTSRCLGSYVFFWGQKQERTHTWFSMFLETGEKTAMVDMMQQLWTGEWPDNRSPYITDINFNNSFNSISRYLHPGETYPAWATAEDPEGDSLYYHWEIRAEGRYKFLTGGEKEPLTQPIEGLALEAKNTSALSEIHIQVPDSVGAYRLFLRVSDGKGSAAVANAPFFIIEKSIRFH